MQEVLVKIPPTQSKLIRIERFFDDSSVIDNNGSWKKKPIRSTSFTHKFVIEDSTEPVTINLDSIPRDVIPIDVAKEEIQKSYDKGFEEGQMSEMAIAKAEINNFVAKMRTLEGAVQDFEQSNLELLDQLNHSVLDIAKKVSLHIMRAETLTNTESVVNRIEKVIESAKDSEILSVTLHPEAIESLKELNSDIMNVSKSNVRIIEDENLEISDCIIHADSGYLEAKITEELDNMMNALKSQFNAIEINKKNEELENLKEGKTDEDA